MQQKFCELFIGEMQKVVTREHKRQHATGAHAH